MKKIGIHQIDGKHPNLALMQCVYFHQEKGDQVEKYNLDFPLWHSSYDLIYASKIFNFSPMPDYPDWSNVMIGGTGIDFKNNLPPEIAACPPSYTLWPECDYHIGFSMKGCRFRCKFCCVPQKEGKQRHHSDIDGLLLNPNGGNKLMLLDNDFFGGPNWRVNIKRLIELKLKVSFVQGLNIRILTEEQAELLSRCRYYNGKFSKRMLSFAWDRMTKRDEETVFQGINRCLGVGIPPSHMQFFVLIGFDTTPEQDMYRVMKLADVGCRPFVMKYKKDDPYQKAFARWVNRPEIFNTCSWDEYEYNPKNRAKRE